jgi:hypothetical protein
LISAWTAEHERRGAPKPTTGEISSTLRTLMACSQSTPEVPVWALHQLVGDADADDGADHGVRTGGGQAEPPGAQIPENGGDQQGKDHGEAGAGADLENQLDRQQRDDREGHRAGGGSTPARLQMPDQTTAMLGSSEWV